MHHGGRRLGSGRALERSSAVRQQGHRSVPAQGMERHGGPPGGYLFVLWSKPTVQLEKAVDSSIYEQVPLSEYYRVKEAQQTAEVEA